MADKVADVVSLNGRRSSAAASERDIAYDLPESFRKAPPVNRHFNEASDPLYKANVEAMGKSEHERREESGVPKMIQLHRPMPELVPDNGRELGPKRVTFNNDWLKEHRASSRAEYNQLREHYEARQRQAEEAHHPSYADIRPSIGPSR